MYWFVYLSATSLPRKPTGLTVQWEAQTYTYRYTQTHTHMQIHFEVAEDCLNRTRDSHFSSSNQYDIITVLIIDFFSQHTF